MSAASTTGTARTATGAIRADAELRAALAPLVPGHAPPDALEPERWDELLARTVWSRLLEPGDGIAGALIGALGAVAALDHVAAGSPAARVRDAARDRSVALELGQVAAALRRWRLRLDRSATLGDLATAAAGGLRVLDPASEHWPAGLADLGAHAPALLWTRGDPAALAGRRPTLAVVGARACTGYGSQVTADLVEAACTAGAAIVSGAAYGIDAVAHRTALALDSPTIAVLAGGADLAYPRAHELLLHRIAAGGAVCSEVAPGTAPTRWRFLQRNRLIAAISRATLVTEAGVRSGSLNTAGHCAELGRPLGAVPGPITSAASAGCHRLIREYDAVLVADAAGVHELLGLDDRLDLFDGPGEHGEPSTGGERSPALHRRVVDALPLRGSRDVTEIARRAGLEPAEARAALAELELLGRVRRGETPEGGEARWLLRRE